jgi:ribonuclease PH
MNVVMTGDGGLVETQATAERGSYTRAQMNALIDLAEAGMKEIFAAQRAVLGAS